LSETGAAPTGYKLLAVPEDRIAPRRPGEDPSVAWVLDGLRDLTSVGPFSVIAETDSVERIVMSGEVFDGIIVKRGPGGPGKRQRLTWNTSSDPPLWTCSSCGSGLVNGILAHHDSCTEVR
jgi:hypothetical protein